MRKSIRIKEKKSMKRAIEKSSEEILDSDLKKLRGGKCIVERTIPTAENRIIRSACSFVKRQDDFKALVGGHLAPGILLIPVLIPIDDAATAALRAFVSQLSPYHKILNHLPEGVNDLQDREQTQLPWDGVQDYPLILICLLKILECLFTSRNGFLRINTVTVIRSKGDPGSKIQWPHYDYNWSSVQGPKYMPMSALFAIEENTTIIIWEKDPKTGKYRVGRRIQIPRGGLFVWNGSVLHSGDKYTVKGANYRIFVHLDTESCQHEDNMFTLEKPFRADFERIILETGEV